MSHPITELYPILGAPDKRDLAGRTLKKQILSATELEIVMNTARPNQHTHLRLADGGAIALVADRLFEAATPGSRSDQFLMTDYLLGGVCLNCNLGAITQGSYVVSWLRYDLKDAYIQGVLRPMSIPEWQDLREMTTLTPLVLARLIAQLSPGQPLGIRSAQR